MKCGISKLINSFQKSSKFSYKVYTNNYRSNHVLISEKNYEEREVIIKTCGSLYKKWKAEKRFRTVPNEGLTFNLPYIDTGERSVSESKEKSHPLVLALHGAPGSWKDFSLVTDYLHNVGARVVVPSFPNFSHYKPGIFRHSDEEKAQYLQDFLKAIAVPQIDLLICHSSSIYPGLTLCLDEKGPSVKSLVMLNTGTYHLSMKSTRYFKFMKMMVLASEFPMSIKIMQICGPFILKNIIKTPVRTDNILDPLLSATVMVHGNIPKAKEKFLQLVSRDLPILYAFSEDDRLIGKKCSLELAYLLGATDSDIFQYDKDCNLKQRGNESSRLKVMSFEKGSHYVFWKHPDIINNAIADFLFKGHLQK